MNQLEARHVLRGLKSKIRLVRDTLQPDYDVAVTSRLWKAEQHVAQAEELLVLDYGGRVAEIEDEGPIRGI